MQLPTYKLPVPGDSVGAYRVVEHVGRGGQGHVFKAEYAGRFFALKFFQARPVAPWGEREIDILRRLEHPHVVRVLGYGRWPDPERGFLYIVMEWVEGLTLEEHARVHGLSAREAATLMLKMTRALAQVHLREVLHRDIKPDNILVRQADGEPVLVDFGVGHLEGFSSVEGRGQLVGTPEFHSPEAYDFLWENYGCGEHYRADVSDEVWALGVTLYWVLTRSLPFGSRATNPHMVKDIRTRTPRAPHEHKARVPVALGEVCMRLLEKEPQARGADMEAVGAALETVLAGAVGDASWDVPLNEPEARPVAEAEEARVLVPEPRPPAHEAVPAPEGAAEQPAVPPAPARPPEAGAPERAEEAPSAPASSEGNVWRRALSRLLPTGVGVLPVRAIALGGLWRAALVLVPVMVVATVGAWLFAARTSAPVSVGSTAEAGASSSQGLTWQGPTPHASVFREVAALEKPTEAEAGALPYLSPLPASEFAQAMLRKEESRVKTEEKPKPPPQRKARQCIPLVQTVCTAAGVCTLVLTGCANTPQVLPQAVHPPPERAACPPDAVETMRKELGIRIGEVYRVTFPIPGGLGPDEIGRKVAVREGFTLVESRGEVGKLPAGTQFHGRLFFEPDLVQGRFTEARTPEGRTYSVCMQFESEGGVGAKLYNYSGPDSAIVFSVNSLRAVREFYFRRW